MIYTNKELPESEFRNETEEKKKLKVRMEKIQELLDKLGESEEEK